MSRKIMSMLLSIALLMSCISITSVLANASDSYYINIDFEDVSDFDEFLAKPEVNKANLKKGPSGSVNTVYIPGRGNVLVSRFSDKFDANEENNSVQFYADPAISLVNNKVVMEAKVYPTGIYNYAIRLFEHTWSSGNSACDPLVTFQNGKIEGANGSELTQYSINQWYHVFVVVNSTNSPEERTYDVYVNGEKVGPALQQTKSFITSDKFEFINVGHKAWDNDFCYCYIDDIKIYEYTGLGFESGTIANNQQNVNPGSKDINLDFTAPLNSDTLGGIRLKDSNGNEVAVTPELDSLDKSVLNIKINGDLNSGKNYTLTFEGMSGVFGEIYNDSISFKTGAPMMNMTSIPKDGATNVGALENIVLSFEDPINPVTFDKSKIEISGLTQNDFKAELTEENVITVTLYRPLYDATAYTLTLSDTIRSTESTDSKAIFNKSLSFTTGVPGKFTDEFDNYVRSMYDYSKKDEGSEPNFTLSSESNNNVDNSVLTVAYNTAPAYMIYYIEDGIHSFRLDKHVGNSQRPDKDGPVKIYVASEYDKQTGSGNWKDVTPPEEVIEVSGLQDFLTAYKHEMITNVPEGSKYLKVEIGDPVVPPLAEDGRVNIWSPELSRIEINHVPVLKFATITPPVIESGDWINLDFTSPVKETSFEDAIAVTDKSGNPCDIKYAISDNFGKRVKIKIAGGLDEQSQYTVTVDPGKITGVKGTEFSGANEIVFRTGIKKYQLRVEFLSGQSPLDNTADGTITVKGRVLSKESDAQIVIARYDANGVFMDIKAPNAFYARDAQSMFEEVLTGCDKTDTIKVFCFDSLDTVKFLGEYEVLEPAQ